MIYIYIYKDHLILAYIYLLINYRYINNPYIIIYEI